MKDDTNTFIDDISATFIIILLSLLNQLAFAASFDCSKASTKVEKLVCDDANLSKLDEELGKAYGEAKKKVFDLNDEQRAWLKSRNKCIDTECLTNIYRDRINILQNISINRPVQNPPRLTVVQVKKYPPYPDVWGYEFPAKNDRSLAFHAVKIPNGDYFITYISNIKERENNPNQKLIFQGISFFSKEKTNLTGDEYNKFWKKNKENRIKRIRALTFKDGSKIECSSDYGCNLFSSYLTKEDSQGRTLSRINLIYFSDKPRKINISTCDINESLNRDYVKSRVENIHSANFILLEDETFLMFEEEGNMVIRFDSNFNTKSDLINKHIFVIDKEIIENLRENLGEKNKIEKVDVNDQTISDVVEKYIMKSMKQ
ncbi:MAG: DUF1311 domain-containing protein [Desulfobacterales bacterium]|nr:DUF1311 domain-containing protein [Desulfobacterales bacterium]